jgi:hypothetical protein
MATPATPAVGTASALLFSTSAGLFSKLSVRRGSEQTRRASAAAFSVLEPRTDVKGDGPVPNVPCRTIDAVPRTVMCREPGGFSDCVIAVRDPLCIFVVTPRRRMPFRSSDKGTKRVSMTWRAT